MSLRFIVKCAREKLIEKLTNLNKEKNPIISFEERLKSIQFNDISDSFPNEYFLIDFEPLYFFYRLIKRRNYVLLNNQYDEKELLSDLLNELFIEKMLERKISFFLISQELGKISFEDFKTQEYERNCYNSKYPDYNMLKHDVFFSDNFYDANIIKSAIELKWSNSIFVSNSDKSHRFALLCKWNDLENLKDSELFAAIEISINAEKKDQVS